MVYSARVEAMGGGQRIEAWAQVWTKEDDVGEEWYIRRGRPKLVDGMSGRRWALFGGGGSCKGGVVGVESDGVRR